MTAVMTGVFRPAANPKASSMTMTNSRATWPTVTSGPTTKPRRTLSVTIAVDTGPGVMTAAKPTAKD